MSKKISTIFLSLFLIGILSVSCSNKDKTAPDTSTPKTIDPKYSGIWTSSYNPDAVEIDINGNIYEYNSTRGNKGEVLESTDPSYKVKIYGKEIKITFKDVNNATVNIDGQDVTYTKTSKGIEQYAGTYKSDIQYDTTLGKNSIYIRVNSNGSIDMAMDENFVNGGNMPASTISGSGNNYNIDSGDDNVVGTLKIDANKATLNFTKQVGFERDEKLKLLIGQDILMTRI